MKTTVVDDVILALVSAFDTALDYPVFDGPPDKRTTRDVATYLVVGAEDLPESEEEINAADMEAEWYGLGQVARQETLSIHCVAVGKAVKGKVATARHLASSVIQDVTTNMPRNPTSETYACQVGSVNNLRVRNASGGSVALIQFTITAKARLV